jgi:hypothetical protein
MDYYRELLRQSTRIEPFRRAIRAIVGRQDRVLEVGAGVGTYSFFAADAGAAHVWAVEGNPVIHVAETIAQLNGYAGRIEFLRGWIPEVTIPDRATVLIFEDFPPRLLDARCFRLLEKLRERYLEPDARILPQRGRLSVVPVYLEANRVSSLAPLGGDDEVAYGIDWAPTREYVANTVYHLTVPSEAVRGTPQVLADLPFDRMPEAGEIGGEAVWMYERDTDINGLAYWFDLELVPGERLSNAPGVSPGSWGQLFLPLDPPMVVPAGQTLEVSVRPERLTDGAPGWLFWRATTAESDGRGHEFASAPAAFADLYQESPDAVPRLSEIGTIEAEILQLVDGRRSVGEIAAQLRTARAYLGHDDVVRMVLRALRGKTIRPALSEAHDLRQSGLGASRT